MGEIENTFIQRLGISVAEVMQRLVTDEVLHAVDARHIHRLLASNDKTASKLVRLLVEPNIKCWGVISDSQNMLGCMAKR